MGALEHAARTLREWLDARNLTGDPRYNVELAFEEIAANIVRHGSPSGDVEVDIHLGDDEIVMTFEDDGVAFDPREQPAPVTPTSIDEAKVGGLGIVLLRTISTRMDYARTPQGRNVLTIAIPAR